MRSMDIKNPLGPDYTICIDRDFKSISSFVEAIGLEDLNLRKAMIVTDSNVGPLYAEALSEELSRVFDRVCVFTFPAGEENKTLDTVRTLYTELIEEHFDRKDLLFALGGGVTGDLCGYASATYLRGCDFIQVPTSLLSMVDSSIGGKTGVDFDSYKNMVGAFHMPRLVYMNISLLKTLDERQFACGMGEIIKHGFIRDRAYLDWIFDHKSQILDQKPDVIEELIFRSCNIKGQVVEEDPKETGVRAHLNFGHTLGHAIEKLMDFKLTHGECVALGCVAAGNISLDKGLICEGDNDFIKNSLAAFGLGTGLEPMLQELYKGTREEFLESVIRFTRSDKKAEHGKVKFILLEDLGKAITDRSVTEIMMRQALVGMM